MLSSRDIRMRKKLNFDHVSDGVSPSKLLAFFEVHDCHWLPGDSVALQKSQSYHQTQNFYATKIFRSFPEGSFYRLIPC